MDYMPPAPAPRDYRTVADSDLAEDVRFLTEQVALTEGRQRDVGTPMGRTRLRNLQERLERAQAEQQRRGRRSTAAVTP